MATLTIPARFNGPAHSGNGGYCAGAFAALVGEPAEVALRRPVPLDVPLSIEAGRISAGGEDIGSVAPAPGYVPQPPPDITPDDARAARANYRGARSGEFAQCFVCGRERHDGLGVFCGRVGDRRLVACTWTPREPPASEIVWAVLDCPTYAAAFVDGEGELPLAYLVNVVGQVLRPIPAGEELIVAAWPTRAPERRKRWASSALLTAGGELLAACDALMVQPR